MSLFGKILVLCNVGLSLCFASWALALYTNRVDWSERKGKEGKPDGELAPRKAQYKELGESSVRPAEARWGTRSGWLASHEYYRNREQRWYNDQLNYLRTGFPQGEQPRRVSRNADGSPVKIPQLQLDDQGRVASVQFGPVLDRNNKERKLQHLAAYVRELTNETKEATKALERIAKAAQEDKEATAELHGSENTRGLHARLRDEYAQKGLADAEYAEVRPEWLNAVVEDQNLRELTNRMEERRKELCEVLGIPYLPLE